MSRHHLEQPGFVLRRRPRAAAAALLCAGMLLSAISLLQGCTTLGDNYRTAIGNLRDSALSSVDTYAETTDSYYKQHGEQATIEASKRALADTLKDPDSARFRDVRVVDYRGGKVVCGEVNGKNSYGAYVGFRRFVAGIKGASLWMFDSSYQDVAAAANSGITTACGA